MSEQRPKDESARGAPVLRPPVRLYEVRTVHGEVYIAEGDLIEQDGSWFTLWGDEMTVALRLPEADVRAVRHVAEGELEARAKGQSPVYGELIEAVHESLGIDLSVGEPDVAGVLLAACRELGKSEAARDKLRRDRAFWEKAATKNGELYAACENQRDDAREAIARVRKAIAERRMEVTEFEAENEPSAWSDAVTVTCSRIEYALREPVVSVPVSDDDPTSKEQHP